MLHRGEEEEKLFCAGGARERESLVLDRHIPHCSIFHIQVVQCLNPIRNSTCKLPCGLSPLELLRSGQDGKSGLLKSIGRLLLLWGWRCQGWQGTQVPLKMPTQYLIPDGYMGGWMFNTTSLEAARPSTPLGLLLRESLAHSADAVPCGCLLHALISDGG